MSHNNTVRCTHTHTKKRQPARRGVFYRNVVRLSSYCFFFIHLYYLHFLLTPLSECLPKSIPQTKEAVYAEALSAWTCAESTTREIVPRIWYNELYFKWKRGKTVQQSVNNLWSKPSSAFMLFGTIYLAFITVMFAERVAWYTVHAFLYCADLVLSVLHLQSTALALLAKIGLRHKEQPQRLRSSSSSPCVCNAGSKVSTVAAEHACHGMPHRHGAQPQQRPAPPLIWLLRYGNSYDVLVRFFITVMELLWFRQHIDSGALQKGAAFFAPAQKPLESLSVSVSVITLTYGTVGVLCVMAMMDIQRLFEIVINGSSLGLPNGCDECPLCFILWKRGVRSAHYPVHHCHVLWPDEKELHTQPAHHHHHRARASRVVQMAASAWARCCRRRRTPAAVREESIHEASAHTDSHTACCDRARHGQPGDAFPSKDAASLWSSLSYSWLTQLVNVSRISAYGDFGPPAAKAGADSGNELWKAQRDVVARLPRLPAHFDSRRCIAAPAWWLWCNRYRLGGAHARQDAGAMGGGTEHLPHGERSAWDVLEEHCVLPRRSRLETLFMYLTAPVRRLLTHLFRLVFLPSPARTHAGVRPRRRWWSVSWHLRPRGADRCRRGVVCDSPPGHHAASLFHLFLEHPLGREFVWVCAPMKLAEDVLSLMTPMLIRHLVMFLREVGLSSTSNPYAHLGRGLLICAALIVCVLGQNIIFQYYLEHLFSTTLRVSSALTALMMKHTLYVPVAYSSVSATLCAESDGTHSGATRAAGSGAHAVSHSAAGKEARGTDTLTNDTTKVEQEEDRHASHPNHCMDDMDTSGAHDGGSAASAPRESRPGAAARTEPAVLSREGEVVSLMTVDTQNCVTCLVFLHNVWGHPIILLSSFATMYSYVGMWSTLATIAAVVLLAPINRSCANRVRAAQRSAKNNSARISDLSTALASMRTVKGMALEQSLLRRIAAAREQERVGMARIGWADSIVAAQAELMTLVTTLVCCGSYLLVGGRMDAGVLVPTMAVLNVMSFPLLTLPGIFAQVSRGFASMRRIERYLARDGGLCARSAPSTPPAAGQRGDESLTNERGRVVCRGCSFSWTPCRPLGNTAGAILQNVRLNILPGEFVVVRGSTGSGKSALLLAILGELYAAAPAPADAPAAGSDESGERGTASAAAAAARKAGGCAIGGRVAYCGEVPWLRHQTVRENIRLLPDSAPETAAERRWYAAVLEACALTRDVACLTRGDRTNVGEGGSRLSGGQRARVAMARAVWALPRTDVYVMDDVLSALDVDVQRHILVHVFRGLLRGRGEAVAGNRPTCPAAEGAETCETDVVHPVMAREDANGWPARRVPTIILSTHVPVDVVAPDRVLTLDGDGTVRALAFSSSSASSFSASASASSSSSSSSSPLAALAAAPREEEDACATSFRTTTTTGLDKEEEKDSRNDSITASESSSSRLADAPTRAAEALERTGHEAVSGKHRLEPPPSSPAREEKEEDEGTAHQTRTTTTTTTTTTTKRRRRKKKARCGRHKPRPSMDAADTTKDTAAAEAAGHTSAAAPPPPPPTPPQPTFSTSMAVIRADANRDDDGRRKDFMTSEVREFSLFPTAEDVRLLLVDYMGTSRVVLVCLTTALVQLFHLLMENWMGIWFSRNSVEPVEVVNRSAVQNLQHFFFKIVERAAAATTRQHTPSPPPPVPPASALFLSRRVFGAAGGGGGGGDGGVPVWQAVWFYGGRLTVWLTQRAFPPDLDGRHFLISYACIGLVAAILSFARSRIFSSSYGCISNALQSRVVRRIFAAPASYFDRTSSSALLQVLSSDQHVVDHMLGQSVESVLLSVVQVMALILFYSARHRACLLALPLIAILFHQLNVRFIRLIKQLRALEGALRVRAVGLLKEALKGAVVIRAHGHTLVETLEGELYEALDCMNTASYLCISCERWMSLRLELCTLLGPCALAVVSVLMACLSTRRVRYANATLENESVSATAAFTGLGIVTGIRARGTLSLLSKRLSMFQSEYVSAEQIMKLIRETPQDGRGTAAAAAAAAAEEEREEEEENAEVAKGRSRAADETRSSDTEEEDEEEGGEKEGEKPGRRCHRPRHRYRAGDECNGVCVPNCNGADVSEAENDAAGGYPAASSSSSSASLGAVLRENASFASESIALRERNYRLRTSRLLLDVRHLSARYQTHLPYVLSDVNFTLRAGECVGLIGRTGNGKSTIFGALLQLMDDIQGEIRIPASACGGASASHRTRTTRRTGTWTPQTTKRGRTRSASAMINSLRCDREQLCNNFYQLVTQEPFLLQGTIRSNLLLGLDEAVTPHPTHGEHKTTFTSSSSITKAEADAQGAYDGGMGSGGSAHTIGDQQLMEVLKTVSLTELLSTTSSPLAGKSSSRWSSSENSVLPTAYAVEQDKVLQGRPPPEQTCPHDNDRTHKSNHTSQTLAYHDEKVDQAVCVHDGEVSDQVVQPVLSQTGGGVCAADTAGSVDPTGCMQCCSDDALLYPLLDHVVMANGSNLSAGQRQLLCLARVLLHHPSVVLLDEISSCVDAQTELLVRRIIEVELLKRGAGGGAPSCEATDEESRCGVLLIAHRLETVIALCDRVLVIDQGRCAAYLTKEQVQSMNDLRLYL